MRLDGKSKSAQVSPAITAGAYTAGKIVGSLMSFTQAVADPQSGVLHTVVVSDKAKQDSALDLVLFRSLPAGTFTDAATFAPSAADLLLIAGVVKLLATDYSDFSANSVATKAGVGLQLQLGATTLYGLLVSRGTPTYTSTSDLQVTMGVLQD